MVVHPGEVILPELGESLGRYAEKQLGRRGVEIRLKTKVTGYDGKEVTLDDGTKIATRMLIWTAGTTPPPLLSSSAVRHAAGPRRRQRLPSGAGLARRVGIGRLRARARSAKSRPVLSAHGAARHPPGRGAGE